MRSIKLFFFTLVATIFLGENATAQIIGVDCYLMGTNIELGIHPNGYPGTTPGSMPGALATHYRGFTTRLSYLSNPDETVPWGDYDGDYYMPGSPENRFGMEVDGVTVYNSSATGTPGITPISLTGYTVYGKCKSVDWAGSYAGIEVDITYIIDTTKAYYRMVTTLTNTNPIDKTE